MLFILVLTSQLCLRVLNAKITCVWYHTVQLTVCYSFFLFFCQLSINTFILYVLLFEGISLTINCCPDSLIS